MDKNTFSGLTKTNIGIFVIVTAINLFLASVIVFSYNPDVRGVEPNVIHTIQSTLYDNGNLYKNPEQIPYSISQYMPFYYIVCDIIVSSLDLAPGKDVYSIYVICRGLSFICAILLSFCMLKIMHDVFEFGLYESGVVAAFSLFVTVPWLYLARPDVFVSLFSFFALYLFLRYMKDPETKFGVLFFSGFFCFFSFFSKQNGLITFLILASYLGFRFRFKDLSILMSGFLIGCLIGYIFYMPYSSSFFLENTYLGVADNGINFENALVKTFNPLMTRFGMIVILDSLALLFLVKTIGFKKLDEKIRLIIYYFAILAFFSCLTSMKDGAGVNQFDDTLVLSFVVLALSFRCFFQHYDLSIEINFFRCLLCLVVLSFGFTLSIQNYYSYGVSNFKTILKNDNPYNYKIVDFLNSELLKNDDFHFLATTRLLNNRFPANCIFPQLDIVVMCTFPRKTFSYSDFEKNVNNGRIKYFITNIKIADRKVPDFLNVEMEKHFSYYKTVGVHDVYLNNNG